MSLSTGSTVGGNEKLAVSPEAKKKRLMVAIGGVTALIAIYMTAQFLLYVTTDNAQIEAHSVMLAPKVSGFVTVVNVVEGQRVKSGDVLVQLDERDYRNTLKQMQGELASFEAKRRDAERNFGRMSQLFKSEAISNQQYDQASAGYQEIKAKYDAIAAQVAQAELNLANTKIVAPSDGFIARRSANIGQLAVQGVPLVGFVDGQERWVIANFKETELEGVKIGKDVDVKVDAISGKTFKGHVESISAATGATFTLLPPDNATGNFTKVVQRVPVRIKLDSLTADEIESLRAGLSAEAKVHRH